MQGASTLSVTESEQRAFDFITRSSGFDPRDSELTTIGSCAHAAHAFVNVRRRSHGFKMTYATAPKCWSSRSKTSLRAGIFGRAAGTPQMSVH